jgi:pSer/pThr/pTyr-binding forkhead associated (FHA) protein
VTADTARLERPQLLVKVTGTDQTWTFDRSFSIGRAETNDVVVRDPAVSQRHAEILLTEGEWRVRDAGSTNGTFVGDRRIDEIPIQPPVPIRLGYHGPTLHLLSSTVDHDSRETMAVPPPRVSVLADRYFSAQPPQDMGEQTAKMRKIVMEHRRRQAKKYQLAVVVLAVVAIAAWAVSYWQHQQVEKQRAAAGELFYAAKALELEVGRLQLSAEERRSYRDRRAELERQYQQFVEALGLYDEDTDEELRLVYDVIHRFGESEVNVPREFVDEVLRYVDRWKATNELEVSLARANDHGYGTRIAQIMLENDLPPEFFYLALQESRLKLEAVGPETRFGYAKGMWQFLPSTGRAYGLNPGPLVGQPLPDPLDERHDFEKSTRAAAEYLFDIYTTDAQASGLLVIASYNWGQTNVLRLIRSLPETPRDRNFWNLLEQYGDRIPRETYGYVFRIVSAAVIGENPELFGFSFEPPLATGTVDAAAPSSGE